MQGELLSLPLRVPLNGGEFKIYGIMITLLSKRSQEIAIFNDEADIIKLLTDRKNFEPVAHHAALQQFCPLLLAEACERADPFQKGCQAPITSLDDSNRQKVNNALDRDAESGGAGEQRLRETERGKSQFWKQGHLLKIVVDGLAAIERFEVLQNSVSAFRIGSVGLRRKEL